VAEGEGELDVEAADDLYAVPLDRFVAERDALAKRLRHDGEKEPAAAVRKLRKPSVPAAAVNSAVRSRPKLAKAVVDAGERLGAAQHAALAGEARAEQRVRRAEKALEAADGAADDARSAAGKVAEEASEADDAVATARTQLGRAERAQAKAAKKLETAQSQLESAEEEREARATELAEARAEAEQN